MNNLVFKQTKDLFVKSVTIEEIVRQKVAVNAKKDLMKEKIVQKKDKKQKLKKDKEIIKDSD